MIICFQEVQTNHITSIRAIRAEIIIARIAMPDSIVINSFAFGAAVASVVVTVVFSLNFLSLMKFTFSSIILMRLCL